MTTTPDYAWLIERLDHRASTMNGAEPVGAGEGHTYVTGYYTVSDRMLDREAATALRALLERNEALERERTNLIETKREQIGRLQKERDEQWKRADTLAQQNAYHKDRAEAALADRDKEIAALRAERDFLQEVLDTRPAINAALPESYIRWSQSLYSGEAARASLSARNAGGNNGE